jgi:F0F1-type ATP synthase alpha subunit
MNLNPSEISDLIKNRIQNMGLAAQAKTEGTVVSVTDGICRVHGLADVMQGEMLEFPGNTFGLALNLERDSVGSVILGEYEHISEAIRSSAPAAFSKCRSVRNCLVASSTRWASRSTARVRSMPS